MSNEMEKQAQELVNKLTIIKQEFIKNKEELLVSIRRDEVAVQLKDILNNSNTLQELQQNIQNYINTLYFYNKGVITNKSENKDNIEKEE